MNFWGFTPDIFDLLRVEFEKFLAENKTPEFFIPGAVGDLVKAGEVRLELLVSKDSWLGITYADELDRVRAEIAKLNYPKLI